MSWSRVAMALLHLFTSRAVISKRNTASTTTNEFVAAIPQRYLLCRFVYVKRS